MIALAPQYTQRFYFWTAWKAVEAIKGGQVQYDDDGAIYTVYFYDGPEVHLCTIWKGTVPDGIVQGGYTQAQNDSDKSDFETNFKPSGNGVIEPKAADGRISVRTTAASKAKNFNLKVFSFVPGTLTSLFAKKPNSTNNGIVDAGDVTLTCYDVSGSVTTDPTQAVITTADWEPTYNYELIGGWIDFPTAIVGSTIGVWTISAVGVPDIPFAYGGSVPFVFPVDLSLVSQTRVASDGRASQYLVFNSTYHTNKLRWILTHPVSNSASIQIYVESFR